MTQPLLSICINTRNRADLLVETLDSMIDQITGDVEIIVVDGASDDSTPDVMQEYASKYKYINYVRSDDDIGIDDGYDLSVENACGQYCWLMPDDDLICEDALETVLCEIKNNYELIILNLQLYTKNMNLDLNQRLFNFDKDKTYTNSQFDDFLSCFGFGLSYIGCVVIKRSLWFEHERSQFYGSYFVHVGVICGSSKLNNILFINKPSIKYRGANSSWTARSFEIWYFRWPKLIWSFNNVSNQVKSRIVSLTPWERGFTLLKSRAMGEYSYSVFRKSLASEGTSIHRLRNAFISILPKTLLNVMLVIFCLMFRRNNHYTLYTLIMSSTYPVFLSRLSGLFGIKLSI